MRRQLSVCGSLLIVVAAASSVSAQVVRQRPISEHVGLGVALGGSGNGDVPASDHGWDVAFSLEIPFDRHWRVRGDIGRVAWPFEFHEDGFRVTIDDRMIVIRSTLSLLMASPASGSLRLGRYAGIGAGLYHYSFDRGYAPASNRAGFNALAGLEVVPSDRVALTGEVQLHIIDGPTDGAVPPGRDGQVFGSLVLGLRGAVGVKLGL